MPVLHSGKPEVGTGIPAFKSQICVIVCPGTLYVRARYADYVGFAV